MKLFHTENDKEVVFVQMQDIMYLNESDLAMPASIYLKVFNKTVMVDDSNRFDFVRFDKEYEVEFFRNLEFIIDYNQYKDLNDEQLNEEGERLAEKGNEIAEKWNAMPIKEKEQNINMLDEYSNIEYMLAVLTEIYALKHGKRSMPFPDFVEEV